MLRFSEACNCLIFVLNILKNRKGSSIYLRFWPILAIEQALRQLARLEVWNWLKVYIIYRGICLLWRDKITLYPSQQVGYRKPKPKIGISSWHTGVHNQSTWDPIKAAVTMTKIITLPQPQSRSPPPERSGATPFAVAPGPRTNALIASMAAPTTWTSHSHGLSDHIWADHRTAQGGMLGVGLGHGLGQGLWRGAIIWTQLIAVTFHT